jgi:hypothetical protein
MAFSKSFAYPLSFLQSGAAASADRKGIAKNSNRYRILSIIGHFGPDIENFIAFVGINP